MTRLQKEQSYLDIISRHLNIFLNLFALDMHSAILAHRVNGSQTGAAAEEVAELVMGDMQR